MNITFICVGELKEGYFRSACAEYEKRLAAFCRFRAEIIPPERLPDSPSQAQINNALQKEGERILNKIPDNAYTAALCVEGTQRSSEELAALLEKLPLNGYSTAAFIIGSSFGLAESVKSKVKLRLSMSEMTFPHQLARVILTEQVYRGFAICANRKYHK